MYLLRPDEEMSNAVLYEAGYAALKSGVDLIMLMQMPNHLHDLIDDMFAKTPEFNELFHKHVAKVGNVLRGREQNFFDDRQTCMVRLEKLEDVIRKIVYVATNPVRAGLVERVKDWPGANGYMALITGKPLRAKRPTAFHSQTGKAMPEEIEVHFRLPERFGDPAPILALIVRLVTACEELMIQARLEKGAPPVMGRNRVMRRSPFEKPNTPKKRCGIRPMFAAIDEETRFAAIQRWREFLRAYRKALSAYRSGTPVPFPHGTFWLVRRLGVSVSPPEKLS